MPLLGFLDRSVPHASVSVNRERQKVAIREKGRRISLDRAANAEPTMIGGCTAREARE